MNPNNFFSQLNKFLDTATKDERINMPHLCVYNALFHCWNKNHFQNPVKIRRVEIMRLSKIHAKTTYHKCMKELQEAGYIKYEPSFKPEGSLVYIINLQLDVLA